MQNIPKIISGGQTGADRSTLDWALSHKLPCGGWCPKGRKAEDGPIDSKYPLRESPSASYLQRTEWNVRDSDASSLASELTGGSSSLKSISSLGFIWRPAISTALRGSKIGWRKNQLMS
jgi:Circularly permutated YpsA SLOG family